MLVTLAISRCRTDGGLVRRNNYFRIGLLVQHGIGDRTAIVGAIAHEDSKERVDLIEQTGNGGRVSDVWRGQITGDDLMFLINCQMKLAPGAAGRNNMLFLMPFVFAVHLESGGILDHEAARFHRLVQKMSW